MTIDFKGHRFEIDANVYIGEEWDSLNPPDLSTVDIEAVYYKGKDVKDLLLDLLNENDYELLLTTIINQHEEDSQV